MPAKKATTTKKAEPALRQAEGNGFAIIETGGKQYRVEAGQTIKIEKLKGELKVGDSVSFDKVLLVDNGTDATDIGTPYIAGASVSGDIVEIGCSPKVTVIKYKQKSRYFKKNGHRQPFFKVKINSIS
jgi:large subunit ribosomal protein L21